MVDPYDCDDTDCPYCSTLGVGALVLASVTFAGLLFLVYVSPSEYLTSVQFVGGVLTWLCLLAVVWVALCHRYLRYLCGVAADDE